MNTEDIKLNTNKDIIIIASKNSNFHILGGVLGFVFTNLLLSIFLLAKVPMNALNVITLILFFAGTYLSTVMYKQEYVRMMKDHLIKRPPLQLIILLISCGLIIFLGTPDQFPGGKKASFHILVLLGVGSAIAALVFQRIYESLINLTMQMIHNSITRRILDQPFFVDRVSMKFKEVQRYGGQFSVILISFFLSREDQKNIEQSLLLPMMFEFLQNNIRRTDDLGIMANGYTAAILSNNNDTRYARIQADRMIEKLKTDEVIAKRMEIFKTNFKAAVCAYDKDIPDGESMILRAEKELKDLLKKKE